MKNVVVCSSYQKIATARHRSHSVPLHASSRRALLSGLVMSPFVVSPMHPATATPLAPLGNVERTGEKKIGLTANEVAKILERDLAVGQYFVTGDLTKAIFDDNCRFKDPTNDVTGLSRYLTALQLLFDPEYSSVRLLEIKVLDDKHIFAKWRLGGYLKFPWNPRVEAFTGTATYTLNDDGLIIMQEETWEVSAAKALLDSFTPHFEPKTKVVA